MTHQLDEIILEAFNNVVAREQAEQAMVRDEIGRNGTHWAAGEIWKLRGQVAGLRKLLERKA